MEIIMTTEEKAKAYDEALRYAVIYYKEGNEDMKMMMKTCFPALVEESEDEKIRKSLLDYLYTLPNHFSHNGGLVTDWIAWLEKQGEKKSVPDWMPKFLDELRSKKNYFDWDKDKDIEGGILAIINWMNPNYFNEKDSKQKPANTVEPKFKVGDFITNDYCFGKVIELTNDAYLLDTEQSIPFSCGHNVHLWTIQDAKDGDVLTDVCGNIGIYNKHNAFDWTSYCSLGRYFQCFKAKYENEKNISSHQRTA